MINIDITQMSDTAAFIEFNDEVVEPTDLAFLQFPNIDGAKGLVIGGFDAWVVAAIATEYQGNVAWIGVLNPSLHNPDECLIIWSEDEELKRGTVLSVAALGLGCE